MPARTGLPCSASITQRSCVGCGSCDHACSSADPRSGATVAGAAVSVGSTPSRSSRAWYGLPRVRASTSLTSVSCGVPPISVATRSRIASRSSGPRSSALAPGSRRRSVAQRSTGRPCPARTVATMPSGRSSAPPARNMTASRVLGSAHWRSSMAITTGPSARSRSTASSSASGGGRCAASVRSRAPACFSSARTARFGTRVVRGRLRAASTVASGPSARAAASMRAVLPIPGSPRMRMVRASPRVAAAISWPRVESSRSRPTSGVASRATSPVLH